MIKIIKVTGSSLSPFFLSGEYVLVWRASRNFKAISPGDYVVFNHSQFGLLIKKVILNDPLGKYIETEGIHPDSLSAQKIGKIPYTDIVGKVLKRIHPKAS